LPIFPLASKFYYGAVLTLCFCGIIYGSAFAFAQVDLKRIIAYSSIVHMSVAIASLFSLTPLGTLGGVLIMISHGFISAGLFFIAGFIYERTGTRNLTYIHALRLLGPTFGTSALILFFG